MISKLLRILAILFVFNFFINPDIVNSFEDTFLNSSSLDNYTIYPNGGNVSISNNQMVITPGSPNTYPYIVLKPSTYTLPIFNAEVIFKYGTITGFGAGIVFDNKIPNNDTFPDVGNTALAWVWNWGAQPLLNYGVSLSNYSPVPNNLSTHKLSINRSNDIYLYKLDSDDAKVVNRNDVTNIWFGNPETTNTGGIGNWPVIYIESVKVNTSSTPSPTPTPTPTQTPTPSPSFPYFSQNDPRWKDEVYDTANKWAGIDKYGIGRWGCALTSAAMVLQKNGVKALDGTDLDPSKLNTWLKSQPDGYVGLGYLNWLAVTRYVRLSYESGHSPTKLEFSRTGTPTFPSIIGLPGHFVVVHGEDGSNWLVNDPSSPTVTKISKTTALKSVNTFVPSMTDLSYMMFTTTSEVNVKINKEHSKEIKIDWQEEQIIDPQSDDEGPMNKIGIIPKPKNGEYELLVTNPSETPKNFDIYLYDKQGQPYIKKLSLGKKSSIKFEVQYNKDRSNKIKIEHHRRYRYIWNSMKKWFDKIWDEFDKWEERLND